MIFTTYLTIVFVDYPLSTSSIILDGVLGPNMGRDFLII